MRRAGRAGAVPALAVAFVLIAGCAWRLAADPPAGPWAVERSWRLRVNGVPEQVWLRGRRAELPLLLVLHGGPGTSEMALFRHFTPGLEEAFLVAHWDQPGTGRSYVSEAFARPLTMEAVLADLHLVVTHLLRATGRTRLVLLGHSWGSALAFQYAQRHPETVALVAGTGQVADMRAGERLSWEYARAQAAQRRATVAQRNLGGIGPPPHTVERMLVARHWVERFGGTFANGMSTGDLVWGALRRPETSLLDLWRFGAGNRRSLAALWPAFAQLDLRQSVPGLEVPVLLLLGRADQVTPAPLAAAYLEQLRAPGKRLVWFERAAHNVPFEQPREFVDALRAGYAALVWQPAHGGPAGAAGL
ncbi:alpha/beta hydrolase [Massilia arenosa]|uniref:Alpha/beta hydrolase n=1 Tax=Zemynaea arenosa TaxID=2561931 RepID=A0A4Y9S7W6_9BURK|nr:alpha/beta hydrolase [Massilia arenosa]TFW15630.1 alpha/beta hydrolase [Massilia arenosa]